MSSNPAGERRGDRYDQGRLVAETGLAVRARGPIQRVFQHAGDAMIVFGRDDNEAITASYRLSKLANLRRRCVSILVFIVERKRQIQNVERDLSGRLLRKPTNVAREKDCTRKLAARPTSLTGRMDLCIGNPVVGPFRLLARNRLEHRVGCSEGLGTGRRRATGAECSRQIS